MPRPATHPAAMVIAVTLTQDDMVPNPPPMRRAPHARWFTWPLLAVGALAIAAPIVASLVPAKTLIDRTRCVEGDGKGACVQIGRAHV